MRLTLIQLSSFAAKWAKLKLTDEDLQALEGRLIVNAECGSVIPGTGGLGKLRFAPPSWRTGKRGASRVIYAYRDRRSRLPVHSVWKERGKRSTTGEKNVFRQVFERLRQTYKT